MTDPTKIIVIENSIKKILFEGTIKMPKGAFSISIDKPPLNLTDYIVDRMESSGDTLIISVKKT